MTFELIPWLWLVVVDCRRRAGHEMGEVCACFGAATGRKLNLSRMRQCDLHTSRKTTPFYGVYNFFFLNGCHVRLRGSGRSARKSSQRADRRSRQERTELEGKRKYLQWFPFPLLEFKEKCPFDMTSNGQTSCMAIGCDAILFRCGMSFEYHML